LRTSRPRSFIPSDTHPSWWIRRIRPFAVAPPYASQFASFSQMDPPPRSPSKNLDVPSVPARDFPDDAEHGRPSSLSGLLSSRLNRPSQRLLFPSSEEPLRLVSVKSLIHLTFLPLSKVPFLPSSATPLFSWRLYGHTAVIFFFSPQSPEITFLFSFGSGYEFLPCLTTSLL